MAVESITKKCEWMYNIDGEYSTSCEYLICFEDNGKRYEEHKFCPFCGKQVLEFEEGDVKQGKSVPFVKSLQKKA